MKLARLEIQQLPGIRPGFAVSGLDGGVNFVTGPNAIGKSSLIRALRYLIAEPAGSDPAALSLAADFVQDGHRWSARRTGNSLQWSLDGQPAEAPPLPGRDSLHCYWLSMENLLRAGDDDDHLVDRLRQALAGGYDLAALRRGDFELRARTGYKEGRTLEAQQRARRQVESEYRALRSKEAHLPEFDRHIEEARQAGIRARHLDDALKLLQIIAKRRETEAALKRFPANMDRLHGDELERLDELETRRAALEAEQRTGERARQDAEARLQRSGLADERPELRDLQAQRSRLDACRPKEQGLAEKRAQLQSARAQEEGALHALGGEQPPRLEPEQIRRAEEFADRLKNKQVAARELAARLQDAHEEVSEQTIQRYTLAAQALMAWLGARKTHAGRKRVRPPALVAALGGALAIVAGSLAGSWLAVIAGVIAAGAALWSLLQPGGDPAGRARTDFARQNLTGPSTWRDEPVSRTLGDLQDKLGQMYLARRQTAAAVTDRARLRRAHEELEILQQEKKTLANKLGFDPALTAVSIYQFADRIHAYQRASEMRQTLARETARSGNDIRQSLGKVATFLARWRLASAKEFEALDAALSELAQRTRDAQSAITDINQQELALERLKKDMQTCADDTAALCEKAGLNEHDRHALEECLAQREKWKRCRERLRTQQTLESERRKSLEAHPALLARAENAEQEKLLQEKQEADEQAAKLDACVEGRSDLRAEVQKAGGDYPLERSRADADKARGALEDRMNEQLLAGAGQFLLDEVEQEHRAEHEPEVLHDARARFRRFTHHAWDVELGENGLAARDAKQGVARELSALSSATRMQLLLAVRMAWARRLEQGRSALPLFLDEALTTCDERRFGAVVESLDQLARREDRQVFYLSARRQEMALWERLAGSRPHCVDLAEVRGQKSDARPADYAIATQQPLPEPGNDEPATYAARLGVPPVAPRAPVGNLHLFHLLRDNLALLHALMQDWNITTLGQLEALLQGEAAQRAIPDPGKREKLRGRIGAARAWVEAWRRGRGRPVERVALEQSGAVSDRFLERVAELARDAHGDAARILASLENKEIPGFRSNKTGELREYLVQEGYLDCAEALDRAGRERRTLREAGRFAPPHEIRTVVSWLDPAAPNCLTEP